MWLGHGWCRSLARMQAYFRGPARLAFAALATAMSSAALVASAEGCGGTVIERGSEGGGGEGGEPVTPHPKLDGGTKTPGKDASKDAFDEYVDPGCGDPEPPNTDYQCDPKDPNASDCFEGDACYIYVIYPSEPCEQETYGSICAPAGAGKQGEPCAGANDCAGGHACVVTGSGTQCVKLCSVSGSTGCPPGLVCEPIDVEGFGGCL